MQRRSCFLLFLSLRTVLLNSALAHFPSAFHSDRIRTVTSSTTVESRISTDRQPYPNRQNANDDLVVDSRSLTDADRPQPTTIGGGRRKRGRPLFGLTYFPWRHSTANCSELTPAMIVDDLSAVSLLADNVQIYGFDCQEIASLIINETRRLGIGLLVRLPSTDDSEYNRQVGILRRVVLEENANVSHLFPVAVGHSELSTNRTNETRLIAELESLRKSLQHRLKVTTIDRIDWLVNRGISPHLDSYVVGLDVGDPNVLTPNSAVRRLVETVAEIRRKAKIDKKRIFIVDIGWPSESIEHSSTFDPRSGSRPSNWRPLPPLQMEFLARLVCSNEKLDPMARIEFFLDFAFDPPPSDRRFAWPSNTQGLANSNTRVLKPYVLQALYWICAQNFPDRSNESYGRGSSSDTHESSRGHDTSGWMWTIVIAAAGFALMLGLLVYFWYRKRSAQKMLRVARSHFMQMRHGDSSTNASDAPFHLATQTSQTESDTYLAILDPHYHDLSHTVPEEWKIDFSDLELKEIVGKGHFGIVQRANLKRGDQMLDVAVKRLHVGAGDVRQFVSEGMRMRVLRHPNVLNLVGIAFHGFNATSLPMIVTPFMTRGDLHSYVSDPENNPPPVQLSTFCIQIAEGMRYLHELKWIHRDLAARNCMLDDTLVVRIADFGLCRCINESESYQSTQMFELPVKWMAPETLEKLEWTTKSDVWSYGIVLWEIMSSGREPYSDVALIELRTYIRQGGRLAKPESCSESIYDMMRNCWSNDPNDRPSFDQICHRLPSLFRRKTFFEYVHNLKKN